MRLLAHKSIARAWTSLLVLAAIGSLRGQNAHPTGDLEDFELEGIAIWQCQCPAYACPCQKNGLPTHGMCHSSDFAHIKKGHLGRVNLDGLNVALVGDLVDGIPERLFGTLYVDQAGAPAQRDALIHVLEYMNKAANDPPVPLRQVKVAPFTFRESPDQTKYTVEIPAILREETLLKRDHSGSPRFSMAAMDLWANVVHNADNVRFTYSDSGPDERWDYSGRYANLKYFDVTKTMYAEQQMLGQHGDNSGKWTPKQLEIIRREKLPDN